MTKEKKDIVLFEEANVEEFNHDEFGNLTTFTIDEDVWFLGNQVAEALGYKRSGDALRAHVDIEDKVSLKFSDFGNLPKFDKQAIWGPNDKTPKTFINESGLYSLIMASTLPSSKKYRRWVTSEVLPTIRKTGSYELQPKSLEERSLELMSELYDKVEEQKEIIEEQKIEIQDMRPKALFSDAVTNSDDSIPIGEFAKYLRQNKVMVGRNRLFEIFRDEGYLISAKGAEYNNPTQYSMERGWFKVQKVEKNIDGYTYYETITRVTGKGQKYFLNKFLDGTLEV